MYLIKGSTRLGLQRVFSTKNLLIRHQPIYFKRKFHPRQDVYYILFAILFSNISKTYKSKTLIVNHFCPGRLYFFKNPSESHLLWTRLLLGTWEYLGMYLHFFFGTDKLVGRHICLVSLILLSDFKSNILSCDLQNTNRLKMFSMMDPLLLFVKKRFYDNGSTFCNFDWVTLHK